MQTYPARTLGLKLTLPISVRQLEYVIMLLAHPPHLRTAARVCHHGEPSGLALPSCVWNGESTDKRLNRHWPMLNICFGRHVRRAIARAPDVPGPDADTDTDAVADAVLAAAATDGGGGGSDPSSVLSDQPRALALALPSGAVHAEGGRGRDSSGGRAREARRGRDEGRNDRGHAVCRHDDYYDAAAQDMRRRAHVYFGAEAEAWFAQGRGEGGLGDEPSGCTLRLFVCLLLDYEPGIVDIVKSFLVAARVSHVPFDELAASSFLTTVKYSMSVSHRALSEMFCETVCETFPSMLVLALPCLAFACFSSRTEVLPRDGGARARR